MRVVFLFLALACLLSAQRSRNPAHESNPLAGNPQTVEAGRQAFLEACSPCHGMTGEGGRGPSLLTGREVRRASDEELFHSIKNGLPATDMPPYPQPNEKVWQVVAFVRSLSAPAVESNVPGDAEAGRRIFIGKAGCSNCHMIRGRGGYLGPDLSDIGATATLPLLQEAVLQPNERLADGFQGVSIELRDGERIEGIAKMNTNYSLAVLDAEGKLHRLRKNDLTQVVFREPSLMPADYSRRLSEEEIQNLLAFLSRQSIREVRSE